MQVTLDGVAYPLNAGESVLEGLLRHGVSVPSFCRNGVCQTCVMKTRQSLPTAVQAGLKASQKQQGCFLACRYRPEEDVTVERGNTFKTFTSKVVAVEAWSADVLRVTLERPAEYEGDAGQFIQLIRPADGLMRPYSIASVPGSHLELHVALLPGGQMSQWLAGAVGKPVEFRGPLGDCVYVTDERERPLLLVGLGTGLAPLLGVVRAALAADHAGSIQLIHGSRSRAGLYAWRELNALSVLAPQLRVLGSVLTAGEVTDGPADETAINTERCRVEVAPIDAMLAGVAPNLDPFRIYIAGNADRVNRLRKQAFLQGASLTRIHVDPFFAPASGA